MTSCPIPLLTRPATTRSFTSMTHEYDPRWMQRLGPEYKVLFELEDPRPGHLTRVAVCQRHTASGCTFTAVRHSFVRHRSTSAPITFIAPAYDGLTHHRARINATTFWRRRGTGPLACAGPARGATARSSLHVVAAILPSAVCPEGFEVLPIGGSGRVPTALWRLKRHLRLVAPDVMHCHDAHAVTSAGLAAVAGGVRVRVASRKVVFPIRFAWRYRMFMDHVIATSRAVAGVCQACGIRSSDLTCIYDGVNPDRMSRGDRQRGRSQLGLTADTLMLLSIGSLVECKGHADLLAALPSILASFPRAILVLAGEGELRFELEQQAERLRVAHAVKFLGFRDDVPDLIKAADLLVVPSRTEATLFHAAGCNVRADAHCGHHRRRDSRSPGQRTAPAVGVLAPPRNPASLAGAILSSLAEPARLRELVAQAKTHPASIHSRPHGRRNACCVSEVAGRVAHRPGSAALSEQLLLGIVRCRILDVAVGCERCLRIQPVRLALCRVVQIDDVEPVQYGGICDELAVASPGDSLGTHDRGAALLGKRKEPGESKPKRLAAHVVGVSSKCLAAPVPIG